MSREADHFKGLARSDSLFALLDPERLDKMVQIAKPVSFSKGKVIFQKGDAADSMFIVVTGKVKIYNLTSAGREYVITFLSAGDGLGEFSALDGGTRSADAMAMDDVEALVIRRGDLRSLAMRDPELGWSLIEALCAKARATTDMLENANLDMTRRTAAALVRLAKQHGVENQDGEWVIQLSMDQTNLAQYAGLSRSNLNRVIQLLSRRELARHEKGVITVLDIDGLEELAESE